jgi:hypothetical protein
MSDGRVNMDTFWRVALASMVLLAAVAFYPRQVVVAPPVDLVVRNQAGGPAAGVLVKQEWGYQAPSSSPREVTLRSDSTGHASFPERAVRISVMQNMAAAALDVVSLGHYGRGPHAMVWAYGSEPTVWSFVYCSVKNPQPHEIVLEESNVPIYPKP